MESEQTTQEIEGQETKPSTKIKEGKVSPNKGQKNKTKRDPRKRNETNLEGFRRRLEPRKRLRLVGDLDGTRAPWDPGECGALKQFQLKGRPKVSWHKPKEPQSKLGQALGGTSKVGTRPRSPNLSWYGPKQPVVPA